MKRLLLATLLLAGCDNIPKYAEGDCVRLTPDARTLETLRGDTTAAQYEVKEIYRTMRAWGVREYSYGVAPELTVVLFPGSERDRAAPVTSKGIAEELFEPCRE